MLEDVHPEAGRGRPRERGLETIPTEAIRGTAVSGSAQRGGDFLPLRPFRSANWRARWQRLLAAADRLDVLPPIDVVHYGDGYWVADGHNRVAAALYAGQVGIDANVIELVAPGASASPPSGPLAPSLVGSRALRSAAGGRAATGPRHEDEEAARREVADRREGGEAGE
jgi:hypothetical protein